ncbi:hypothetical protein HMI54_008250 [Coelomomyces lativittatus]|nr:hypothetical protein HMI54_008250 [Coelomomyces lativittatus]
MSKLISGIGGNGIDGSGGVGPVSIGSNFSLPLNKTFCWLLWEGDIGQHAFQGFKFKQCHTEKQVTELFASVHVEHYWDLAKNWIMPGLI